MNGNSISLQLNHQFIVADCMNRQLLVLFSLHETWKVEPLLTGGGVHRTYATVPRSMIMLYYRGVKGGLKDVK